MKKVLWLAVLVVMVLRVASRHPPAPAQGKTTPQEQEQVKTRKENRRGQASGKPKPTKPAFSAEDQQRAFLERFDKMAEGSDLGEEELIAFREEMKQHSGKRFALNERRRKVLEDFDDNRSPEARVATKAIDEELRELGKRHREIYSEMGVQKGANANFNLNPPKKDPATKQYKDMKKERGGWGGKMTMTPEKWRESMSRREEAIKRRSDDLWNQAKKAAFTDAELGAIREELDEFTGKEVELLKDMPMPPMDPAERERGTFDKEKVKNHGVVMRDINEKRKSLEKRIKERVEL